MCGRYKIKDTDVLTRHLRDTFNIPDWVPDHFIPRYNIAPTQMVLTIAADETGKPQAKEMKWGFLLKLRDSEKPNMQPNARSETAFTKFSFRYSVQKRRCLIPADGFYEWKKLDEAGKLKQPYEIHRKGERPFFFAGIFEEGNGAEPQKCLLFTTRPNEVVAPIHDRMPVILDGDAAKRWLKPGPLTAEEFAAFTGPYDSHDMEAVPISSLVNSVKNNGPEILMPAVGGEIELEPAPLPKAGQQELF
ncbi:MAG TPA: SOS response-associated peptidase [Opitutaceae bacterium]|nr:SOS response-associated peptidase [Opitutaceae bacterium]